MESRKKINAHFYATQVVLKSSECDSLPEDHAKYVRWFCAERHANTDFVRFARHGIGEGAAEADHREEQCEQAKNCREAREHALEGKGLTGFFCSRL
jgi:hypothetical protein